MIRCINKIINGEMKWGLNWFLPNITWLLHINLPFATNVHTKYGLVYIKNRLVLYTSLGYMISKMLWEKYQTQPTGASALTLFKIYEELMFNKGYIAMNFCNHLHPNHFLFIVFIPN